GYLVGKPAKIGTGAIATATTKDRTGDGTNLAISSHFAIQQLLQAGTQAGTNQAGLGGFRASNRHNALYRHFTGFEQLGDVDNVLVVDGPDSFAGRYRIQVMDMGTYVAGRVHT